MDLKQIVANSLGVQPGACLGILPAAFAEHKGAMLAMKRSDELKQKIAAATDRAQALLNTAERANRDLTPAEQQEWSSIMDEKTGTLATLTEELHVNLEKEDQTRRLRAARAMTDTIQPCYTHDSKEINGPQSRIVSPNGKTPLILRNAATGETMRALENHEPTPRTESAGCDVGDVLASLALGREIGTCAGGGLSRSIVSSTSHDYFIRPGFSSEVIDLARSASVCFKAGGRQVMMDTQTLQLVRVLSDPTAYWRHPTAAITASKGGYGALTLTARTVAAAVPISVEDFEDAANLGEVLRQQLAAALGSALDQAALTGSAGGATPIGVASTSGVNTVTSVGTPTNYSKITTAVKSIFTSNYPGNPSGLAWILHPRDAATFDGLQDSTYQPLQPTPWAGALQQYMTTSLPTTQGAGTASSSIIGDFTQLLFGFRTDGMRIELLREGQITDDESVTHNATSELKVILRAYLRADVAVLRPGWFTVLSGITAS